MQPNNKLSNETRADDAIVHCVERWRFTFFIFSSVPFPLSSVVV